MDFIENIYSANNLRCPQDWKTSLGGSFDSWRTWMDYSPEERVFADLDGYSKDGQAMQKECN